MKEIIVACDGYKLSHHFQYPKGIMTLSNTFSHVWFTNSYKDWKAEFEKQSISFPENVTQIDIV